MISIFQERKIKKKEKISDLFFKPLIHPFWVYILFFIHPHNFYPEFTLQKKKMKIPIIFYTFVGGFFFGGFLLTKNGLSNEDRLYNILSYKTCTLSHTYRRNGWMPISAGINIFTMSFYVIFGLQSVF